LELVENKMYLSVALLSLGYADAMVAGAVHATKDVLKPALEARKLYPGIPPVTSSFIMEIPRFSGKENVLFIFADCGLNIEPSAAVLAHIANASNSVAKEICGLDPKIAFLSFSTKGSAQHSSIDKMKQALEITKQKFPTLKVDGELQADAAIVDWIGKAKAPESSVAGKANVLIFPDLNSGNIAYKLVERFAGAKAIGPVISGLNPPTNDLSRGCSIDDIIDSCAISSIQSNIKKTNIGAAEKISRPVITDNEPMAHQVSVTLRTTNDNKTITEISSRRESP
jgi:phosphate acetyltransferase